MAQTKKNIWRNIWWIIDNLPNISPNICLCWRPSLYLVVACLLAQPSHHTSLPTTVQSKQGAVLRQTTHFFIFSTPILPLKWIDKKDVGRGGQAGQGLSQLGIQCSSQYMYIVVQLSLPVQSCTVITTCTVMYSYHYMYSHVQLSLPVQCCTVITTCTVYSDVQLSLPVQCTVMYSYHYLYSHVQISLPVQWCTVITTCTVMYSSQYLYSDVQLSLNVQCCY